MVPGRRTELHVVVRESDPPTADMRVSSERYASSSPTGTPNPTARTEREAAGTRSTASETLRSCAIFVPARTPTRTAVPTAIPQAARSAPDERRRTRCHANPTT